MAGQWVNQAPSGGVAPDPWTEGPNLLGDSNPDFEIDDTGDSWWAAYFNNETVEIVTAGALSGTQSLHVLTTGEANESEGLDFGVPNDAGHRVASEDRLRFRFTIAGTTGSVRAWISFVNTPNVGAGTVEFVVWEGSPTVKQTVQVDFTMTSGGVSQNLAASTFRPHTRFVSFNAIADFTLDDLYLGVLTAA